MSSDALQQPKRRSKRLKSEVVLLVTAMVFLIVMLSWIKSHESIERVILTRYGGEEVQFIDSVPFGSGQLVFVKPPLNYRNPYDETRVEVYLMQQNSLGWNIAAFDPGLTLSEDAIYSVRAAFGYPDEGRGIIWGLVKPQVAVVQYKDSDYEISAKIHRTYGLFIFPEIPSVEFESSEKWRDQIDYVVENET